MYNESDYANASRQTHVRAALGTLLALLFLALFITLTALEQQVLQMVAAGIGFIVCYFVWSMKIVPWIHYNKFLKELRSGRKRELYCEFIEISPDTRFFDRVEVRDVLVRTESDEVKEKQFDERLFVLDADKSFPEIAPGSNIIITSFGSFVTDVKPAAVS